MAESKNNVITHGLSGKLGDMIVFKNRSGKTYVATKPKERTGEPTENQKMHQKRFQEAVFYAKTSVTDPNIKSIYEDKATNGASAYNVAVADFFRAPNIEVVDLSKYSGKIGDQITIRATDDFKVVELSVSIHNVDGTEVEHGHATLAANGMDWNYVATAENTSLAGDRIVVRASDLPGNITEETKVA